MNDQRHAHQPLRRGGLVTVAFLKAELDQHQDHLGLFMPLVIDVIASLSGAHFSVADIQAGIADAHGLDMPQQVIVMLLRRAERNQIIECVAGRYQRGTKFPVNRQLSNRKRVIGEAQARLARAFVDYASARNLDILSIEQALDILLELIDRTHVAMVLNDDESLLASDQTLSREQTIAAEFIHRVAAKNSDLRETVSTIVQGLVLYYAILAPGFEAERRSLHGLTVYFDTPLVLKALGYEGEAARSLLLDSIALLKREGVALYIFDDTIAELHRIFGRYINNWATSSGRQGLARLSMTSHFELMDHTVADLIELDARLEDDIRELGIRPRSRPAIVPRFLLDEAALAERLSDPQTKDTNDPRVVHDVNCVTAILTLRRDGQSVHVASVRALFVTDSVRVLRTVREWYREQTRDETGIAPVMPLRVLATIAWLRNPAFCRELKMDELLATCSAALRPKAETWERFRLRLEDLVQRQEITKDEMTLVFRSSLAQSLLREAEADTREAVDTHTLDEIRARVLAEYRDAIADELHAEQAQAAIARESADAANARADAVARAAYNDAVQRAAKLHVRNRKIAAIVAWSVFYAIVALTIVGAIVVFEIKSVPSPFHLIGALGCVVLAGITLLLTIRDLCDLRTRFVGWIARQLDRFTAADEAIPVPLPAEKGDGARLNVRKVGGDSAVASSAADTSGHH